MSFSLFVGVIWTLIGICLNCMGEELVKPKNELVLVTGASGFIGGHIIQQLLEQGYNVRGTVRNLNNHQIKYKYLYDFQDKLATNKLELVEADLSSDKNWNNIVKGCQYVMSVANPVPSREATTQLSDDEMIKTSVGGIKRILNACLKHKNQIKRFILTGSVAANLFDDRDSILRRATNTTWTNTNDPKLHSYAKAKTLQERYLWKFMKDNNNPFEAVSINPCMVIGPVLNKPSGSIGSIIALMNGEFPFLPAWHIVFVDVRDVALVHINALTAKDVVGNRYIIGNYGLWIKDIAIILSAKYAQIGYYIPLNVQYDFVWKLIGLFDEVIGEHVSPNLGKYEIVGDGSTRDLNFQYMAMDQSIYDTTESLIKLGYIKEPSNTMSTIITVVQTVLIGGIVCCLWVGCKR